MRYSEQETTTLGGFFMPDQTVTIKVLDSTGTAVTTNSDACTASPDEPTLYIWSTSNMDTSAGTYFYVMTDGVHKMPGKFTYGGSINKLDTVAKDVWTYDDRTVTGLNADAEQSGMTQDEHDKLFSIVNYNTLHADLDSYTNKAYYKADSVDLTDAFDHIAAAKDELLVKINDVSVDLTNVGTNVQGNNAVVVGMLAHQTKAIDIMRKFSTNRVLIAPDASRITLYDDDGDTVIYEFEMKAQNKRRMPVNQYT